MNANWFSQHVGQNLTAYLHHELSSTATKDFEAHLNVCPKCQQELSEIKVAMELAEKIKVVSPPASLWQGLNDAQNKTQQPSAKIWAYAIATTASLLVGLMGWVSLSNYLRSKSQSPMKGVTSVQPQKVEKSWAVANMKGTMRVGDREIAGNTSLKIGEWLETDNDSRVEIKVAEIGVIEVNPNSRLQLVNTNADEHRISLVQGKMSALIFAPPRLFIVDTPAATAVDLGCSYTLEVDANGTSHLEVISGWVSFVRDGQESFVPAGARCEMEKDSISGTPYFSDASEKFKKALRSLNRNQRNKVHQQVNDVLRSAREKDALSLWHLLGSREAFLTREMRQLIYRRLFQLKPPPRDVTQDGVLNRNTEMLRIWWEERIR